jgi:hypothetical protein
MRSAFLSTVTLAVCFCAAACDMFVADEADKDTYVEGMFEMSTSSDTFVFLGDFGLGGASYYGRCSYSSADESFEFEIGTASPEDISSATDIYLKFEGISGPPIEGVYSDADAKITKEDEELRTLFGSAVIMNGGNEFTFNQPDPADNGNCYVELFATAAEGEVTPDAEEEFDYYVALHCVSLDDVSSGSQPLTAFNSFFFFRGCE